MTFSKTAALALALVFTALSAYPQQQAPAASTQTAPAQSVAAQDGAEPAPDEGQTAAPDLSRLSLFDLLEAAAGTSLDWLPGWPLSLPPGLFRISPENGVVSVAVTFEAPPLPPTPMALTLPSSDSAASAPQTAPSPQAVAAPEETAALPPHFPPISVRPANGVLTEFPVFLEGSADAPDPFFFQGRAEYAGNGALRRITVGGGPDLEAVILDWDAENRPVLARLLIAGQYFFSALEYGGGHVTETRYSPDGAPAAVMYRDHSGEELRIMYSRAAPGNGNAGGTDGTAATEENGAAANGNTNGVDGTATTETRRVYRNAHGAVSGLESSAGTWTALYERRGFPRYLERIPNAAEGDADAAAAPVPVKSVPERYSFQWDENGLLARIGGADADGRPLSDSRYEYTVDSRGNWTECREIVMRETAGRLFPAPGAVIRRRIQYGNGRAP